MNTDYLHSKWTKMKISSIVENEKQVRIGVTLKTTCIKDIDDFKTEKGLFNGRSDFLLSAIRYYYCSIMKTADLCLDKQKNNLSSNQKMKQLKNAISKEIDSHLQLYNTIFDGGEKLQISIHVSEFIDDCLNDIEILSGKKTSEVIQAAIASYRIELIEELHLRDEFIKSINELCDD